MTPSELAFRWRPLVYLVTAVLMAVGAWSYFTLPAQEDPKITIREAVVTTHYPGLSASRVERLITKTLEEAIRQVPEVEAIRSTSLPGTSLIHAEVDDRYFDLDPIWQDLRNRVDAARAELPEGTGRPRVNDDFGDVAVLTAALTADSGFSWGERLDIAQHLRDMLYAVPGTHRIDLLGVQPERVYVETDDSRLAELGLSPGDIDRAVSRHNTIRPGGELDTGKRSFPIEPTGNFPDVGALGDTLVRLPAGELMPLRDVADIRRGPVDPPEPKAYFNGEPAIVFAFSMADGERVLEYGPRLRAALEEAEATLPVGYALEVVTYQPEAVERAVYGVTASVLQTLAIVLAVVVLFLGLRTGLIVGSIVPAVMLITLAVMGFAGMPLERMSLATLVIALGLLVDNGIVVAEDFKRRLELGQGRDAALHGVGRELALPLLSATLTTILVFLPLMLAEHEAGEYTRAISLVILISLSTSWLLAMTVTPSLCHRFIREPVPGEAAARRDPSRWLFRGLGDGYEWLLRRILRHRTAFLSLMLLLLGGSAVAFSQLPQKFFPDSDRPQVLVYLDLPADVTRRTTDRTLQDVMAVLGDRERFPQIERFAAYAGSGGPRFVLSLTPIDPVPNRAFLVLDVGSHAEVAPTVDELRRLFAERFPQLSAQVTGMFLGPSDSSVLEVQVKGPDAGHIYRTAGRIERILAQVPGTIDIRSDWENRLQRVVVDVDETRARRAGVTAEDVARSLEGHYSGRMVSALREGDELIPIVTRAVGAGRDDLQRLHTVSVFAAEGEAVVPLTQVADVHLRADWARIAREDMVRTVTVSARNTRMAAEDLAPEVAGALDALRAELPPGHGIEFDGVVAESAEGRAALAANLPLAIGGMALLLVAQFNGYLRPLIIVLTIPLLAIGAVLGLHLLRAPFGFMPLLGLYALAGILINNAIVLIDRIDIERAAGGTGDFEALIAACVRRLRPILMTTITTLLGLLPLIIAEDALFYGLAAVLACGLAVGTMLTLGVVPVLYSLVFRIPPS
ncbi:efflux RND transporter permease subunit [Spiribacter halobius]|uniref:Acriflavine resistance protein B n=1 Tax=Sediminicurvatus halobius TaxID=2182432 RepID=A0A2U2N2Q9_9GAMM|nr:efflux RND transporter permease subunit [Spiribacter halobius]PWG63521.1 acriflavine resistance protein B [Spiribacter halobius]UEX79607.1 efflux RND transporter permease subunit [Spiribacter halobius]